MERMAGCTDGKYRLIRDELDLSCFGENLVKMIFPAIKDWREQQLAHDGEKYEAATNFLYETLPNFAKVVVQDGIYWVNEFPEHEVS